MKPGSATPVVKYLQLRFAEFVGRVFPRRLAYGLARRLADLYFLMDRRGRECVMGNLCRIHASGGVELSARAQRALARENFLNFAKYMVDFFHFLQLDRARMHRLIDYTGAREALAEGRAAGKGVIAISAHLGNWELGVAALAMEGEPFHAVALQHPNPRLNDLYWNQRRRRGIDVIPLGRAARPCLRALRANEIVAAIADRDFTPALDLVEFFGAPARLPTGPAKLALATGAPLLPIFMVRRPDDTYAYVVEPLIWPDRDRDTVATLMTRIARALERVIRQHSDQWFLFHNPWDVATDRDLATAAAFGHQVDHVPRRAAAVPAPPSVRGPEEDG